MQQAIKASPVFLIERKIILKFILMLILYTSLALLSSCGSDSANVSSITTMPITSNQTLLQGRFIDASVYGVKYSTQNVSGLTDERGYFAYVPGDTITFSIGDIVLGRANAKSLIMPLDLTNEPVINSPKATRIAQLLQSLDMDKNPNNGIKIQIMG